MNLKKNDKIIAIIGVVILIVAAISVIFYVSNQEESDEPDDSEDKVYEVKWTKVTAPEKVIEGSVGSSPYTDPISINLDKDKVLANVNVRLDWTDDKTSFLNTGKDQLTVKISADGEAEPHTSKGSANESVASFKINDRPNDDIYPVKEVKDTFELEDEIKAMYSNMNSVDLNVEITFAAGELLKFRDKGNDFKLIVTYDYYEYEIIDPFEDDNGDNGGDDFNGSGQEQKGEEKYYTSGMPGGLR